MKFLLISLGRVGDQKTMSGPESCQTYLKNNRVGEMEVKTRISRALGFITFQQCLYLSKGDQPYFWLSGFIRNILKKIQRVHFEQPGFPVN